MRRWLYWRFHQGTTPVLPAMPLSSAPRDQVSLKEDGFFLLPTGMKLNFIKFSCCITFFSYIIIPLNMHRFHLNEWKSLKAFKFLYKNMLASILQFCSFAYTMTLSAIWMWDNLSPQRTAKLMEKNTTARRMHLSKNDSHTASPQLPPTFKSSLLSFGKHNKASWHYICYTICIIYFWILIYYLNLFSLFCWYTFLPRKFVPVS